jgi:hypothetical protein
MLWSGISGSGQIEAGTLLNPGFYAECYTVAIIPHTHCFCQVIVKACFSIKFPTVQLWKVYI